MKFARRCVREMQPYQPGYQPPRVDGVIKLNTNENPYPPSPRVLEALRQHVDGRLRLYPDPEWRELRATASRVYGIGPEYIFFGNGSDEILALLFRAFVEREELTAFPYPTYSLYRTLAEANGNPYRLVETGEGFEVILDGFLEVPAKMVLLANPNSPTGLDLPPSAIESFVARYPGLVVVDEAYVDFGAESCLELVRRYRNLVVLRTLSKSFSLCGMRVGYCFADPELVAALMKVKDSYNINVLSQVAGKMALEDYQYMVERAREIARTRDGVKEGLERLGFLVFPSRANFLFMKHGTVPAREIFESLAAAGIYVRYFPERRLLDYLRVTIGTPQEMDVFLEQVSNVVGRR